MGWGLMPHPYLFKRGDTMYPTIDFIRMQTGEDLIINTGTELQAKAEIKQYVKLLLGELKKLNIKTNYNKILYLIKNKKHWTDAWHEAVASLIYEDYNTDRDKHVIAIDVIQRDDLLSIKNVVITK